MVAIVAVPILVGLALTLWREGRNLQPSGASDTRLLVLVALVVGFAILIQAGDRLLGRLRKIGPAEFGEAQAIDNLPALENLVERLTSGMPRLDVSQPSKVSNPRKITSSPKPTPWSITSNGAEPIFERASLFRS